MKKAKNSFNSLVTKVEFRQKISQLERKIKIMGKELRGEMGEMEGRLRGEMGKMETRLGGEIGRLEISLRKDMGEMKEELTDRFFTGWDKLMKELHTIRQEQATHFAAHERINEELARLSPGRSPK